MAYIDLNMVRADIVWHPVQWIHGSYSEIQASPPAPRCHRRFGNDRRIGFSNALFLPDGTPNAAEPGRNAAPEALEPAFGCRPKSVGRRRPGRPDCWCPGSPRRIAAMILSSPPQFGQCSRSRSNNRLSNLAPLGRTGRWCAQFASHSAGLAACAGASGSCGTTCGTTSARSLALGASAPWFAQRGAGHWPGAACKATLQPAAA